MGCEINCSVVDDNSTLNASIVSSSDMTAGVDNVVVVNKGGGCDNCKVVVRSDTQPMWAETLIWIDTYKEPIKGTQLITADDKGFYTSDGEAFVLKEVVYDSLVTADDKQFLTSDDKEFLVQGYITEELLTQDNKEFYEANNKKFMLKGE